jgi:hypothetical protein
MTVPIEMPKLRTGAGETPAQGGCIMQAVNWLATDGEQWSDAPECVHPVLRKVSIWVNDNVTDAGRRQLWPLVPRLLGTATSDRKADVRTSVALAVWAAERVLPLIKDPVQGELAAERVGRARAWLDKGEKPAAAAAAYAAYAYAAYAAAAAAAYAAAAAAAASAAYAAAAAAYADAYADAYAAAAADAAAAAADADAYAAAAADAWRHSPDNVKIKFLTDLIDAHDAITGHTPADIPAERWQALHDALAGQPV